MLKRVLATLVGAVACAPLLAWEAPGGDGFETCGNAQVLPVSVSSWTGTLGTPFPHPAGPIRLGVPSTHGSAMQFSAPAATMRGRLAAVALSGEILMTLSRCPGQTEPLFASCRSGPSTTVQLDWTNEDAAADGCPLEAGASYFLSIFCPQGGCTFDLSSAPR